MTVDLVVLDGHAPSYLQDLGDRITAAVYSVADGGSLDRPGGVFVRRRTWSAPTSCSCCAPPPARTSHATGARSAGSSRRS